MTSRPKQSGFIPGVVMEINVGLVVLGIAVVILTSLTSFYLKPGPLDAKSPELVAVAAENAPSVPEGWKVIEASGGATVIRRIEPLEQLWAVAVLLALTLIALFVFALRIPFWLLLAGTCGVWWHGATSSPVTQYVTIHADGSVELRRSARFVGFVSHAETVAAKDLDSVLARLGRPEAYVSYRRAQRAIGWGLYADTPAGASALATLVRSKLKLPAAPPPKPDGKK